MRLPLADRYVALHARRHWPGLRAALRLRRLLKGSARIRFRTAYGSTFDLEPAHFIDGIALRHGFYESEVLEALRPHLARSGAVYWDVGTNFGLHAITAKRIAPHCTVVAFEPEPGLATRLAAHALLNEVAIEILPVALGDTDGRGTLFVHATNPGASTLRPWSGTSYEHCVDVPVRCAHSLVESGQAPMPTVVKLDVEGAEELALTGFGDLLARRELRAIVVEDVAGWPAIRAPILDRLVDCGFGVRRLERREPTQHGLDNYVAERPSDRGHAGPGGPRQTPG